MHDAFAGEGGQWRICSFHRNQRAIQTGRKPDETGWPIYQSCLAAGAIVATAHEHAYSRTFPMDDFEARHVVHRGDRLRLAPDRSFALVSGPGGRSIRWQWRRGDWWARVLTRWQSADHGALFCRFAAVTAACEFEDVDGKVRDAFTLESAVGTVGATNAVDGRLPSDALEAQR